MSCAVSSAMGNGHERNRYSPIAAVSTKLTKFRLSTTRLICATPPLTLTPGVHPIELPPVDVFLSPAPVVPAPQWQSPSHCDYPCVRHVSRSQPAALANAQTLYPS